MEQSVPKVLGGYELIERVAVGGMASLYLARRAGARGFVRPVAIKLVHPHLAEDREFVEMFVDEANICSRLDHPNIVHVEELLEDSGFLFLVMEFVEGCSLGAATRYMRRRKTRLPVPIVAHIIASAAEGLHAAHEARGDNDEPLHVVHRDVSPSNLLMSRTGHIKIIDFGIAKSTERQHRTANRKIKGKIAYMSPEQVRSAPLDRRSDIYSLGVVCWEMLANRRAFRAADEVALIQEVTSKPLVPIESIREDLPEELVRALQRSTQRSPDARFETAFEFRQAIVAAVPEALSVNHAQIAELVRRVGASQGEQTSSQRRVRSGVVPTGTSPGSEATQLTPSALGNSAVAASSLMKVPDERMERHLGIAVAVATIVCVLLIGAAWYLRSHGPTDGGAPDPAVKGSVAKGTVSNETVGPEKPREAASSTEEPPDASTPSVLSASPDEAPKAPPEKERTAGLKEEESSDEPPKKVEAAMKPSRRRKSKVAEAGRSHRRRRASRKETPKSEPELPATEPKPTVVDGALLASPDDLDRSTARGDSESGKPIAVEEDNVTLAEDYQ